ncbi:Rossmann-like and DUF2520 domain-containing protein [Sphingobacterium rhinopitheci]|uniref:Rossmann-like and DUF2520 domain-containing protein n=1 Tax=Sphingobacterium rhinopitheci TaxID=2781960 RepID=UPI001F520049|nr:Rossmann-like and DUF2520 domain-containing protein [Sphingobacterium rhinopitheci]MCI0921632.1 DUF2520 domain-containing protein [Sphingobacterium rhinopitheci]
MTIVILGAGNIATHYAQAFHALGHEIRQIYNRTSANAKALADVVSSTAIDSLDELYLDADLYIIAISDDYISTVIEEMPNNIKGIVVHTSGATPLSVLYRFTNHGIIYPVQSLNKHIPYDLAQIPFAIEGNTKEVELLLLSLMQKIAPKTFPCNSNQRLALHISAVFVNNFSNALFEVAHSILEKENLSFDLMKPIILETAMKVQKNPPRATQTGPATRNDQSTMATHLKFLSYSNTLSEIYQIMSDLIIKSRQK